MISTQVVVSSVQGYFGLPQRAAYAASKHALHGYFDALRAELAAETAARVSVTVVAPGYIRTGHSLHALTGDGRAYEKNDASTASGADPAAVIDRIRAADAEFCKRTGVSIDTLRREQARVRRR